jgi:UDP-N-acetylglucosamine 2-epimerase (non-hydrolysing)
MEKFTGTVSDGEGIHIFVGTKAQFIKMAPIMQELDRRGIDYNFIDAGQHASLTGELLDQFDLKTPDIRLRDTGKSITTIWQAVGWFFSSMWQLLFRKQQILETVFEGNKGICLIHGDTLTTLVSLLYAKRCGIKVAHVEAGLRSYHLLDPFPEEIIRLFAMRYSDILFTPSSWAYDNLEKMGYTYKAIDVGGNTVVDAVRYALQKADAEQRPVQPYVVFTIHRVETIYSRQRLSVVVDLIEQIAHGYRVLFVVHEPTQQQLLRFGLYDQLSQNDSVTLSPLQPYLQFVALLSGAEFVVTDGGSIQEETSFLNVPCLIMRTKTERMEGLGENAFLADFDQGKIDHFLHNLSDSKLKEPNSEIYPSAMIVGYLSDLLIDPRQ